MAKKVLISAPSDEPLNPINPLAVKRTSMLSPVGVVRNFSSPADEIIEVDVADIDVSDMRDRLDIETDGIDELVSRIETNGQIVPVMLRNHPDPGSAFKYQTVYGHRRILACKQLGRKVRAIVKDLDPTQALIFQALENMSRSNLSFIEKALFASNIEEAGYSREAILEGFSISSATLSQYLSVVREIPIELITAIGKAPGIGRDRWQLLGGMASSLLPELITDLARELNEGEFSKLQGRDRFDAAYEHLTCILLPEFQPSGRFPYKGTPASEAVTGQAQDADAEDPSADAAVLANTEGLPDADGKKLKPAATNNEAPTEEGAESYFLDGLPVRLEANERSFRLKVAFKNLPDFDTYVARHVKEALQKALDEYRADRKDQ